MTIFFVVVPGFKGVQDMKDTQELSFKHVSTGNMMN